MHPTENEKAPGLVTTRRATEGALTLPPLSPESQLLLAAQIKLMRRRREAEAEQRRIDAQCRHASEIVDTVMARIERMVRR